MTMYELKAETTVNELLDALAEVVIAALTEDVTYLSSGTVKEIATKHGYATSMHLKRALVRRGWQRETRIVKRLNTSGWWKQKTTEGEVK